MVFRNNTSIRTLIANHYIITPFTFKASDLMIILGFNLTQMKKQKDESNSTSPVPTITKLRDTLLVFNHTSHHVGLVGGIDDQGHLNIQEEVASDHQPVLIDPDDYAFVRFYSDFYHQLKNPDDFSFFKVTEYEAPETLKALQEYIAKTSPKDYENLIKHAIDIHSVEAIKDHAPQPPQRYLYALDNINWKMLSQLGHNKQSLQELGALEPLLKGYKTPMLIPINMRSGNTLISVEARLSLRTNSLGILEPILYPLRKFPDFKTQFYGHQFTPEDQCHLSTTGNMGRVVELTYPLINKVFPALVSMDRLTHALVFYQADRIQIPKEIKGVQLTPKQQQILREGKVLFLEHMLSTKGGLFSANLQFNAEKGYVEFLFNRNLKAFQKAYLHTREEIPKTFRGKALEFWQYEKLKAGQTAYIKHLTDKNGKAYQGYLTYNPETRTLDFSFKNPQKEQQKNQISANKPKGRKL